MFRYMIISTVVTVILAASMNLMPSLAMEEENDNQTFPSTDRGPVYFGSMDFAVALGGPAEQMANEFYRNNCAGFDECFISDNCVLPKLQPIWDAQPWSTISKDLIEKNLMGFAARVTSPEVVAPCANYYNIHGSETYQGSSMYYSYYVSCSTIDKLIQFAYIMNRHFSSTPTSEAIEYSEAGAFRLYDKVKPDVKNAILKEPFNDKEVCFFITRNFLFLIAVCKDNYSLTNFVKLDDVVLDHIFSLLSLGDIQLEKEILVKS